MPKARSSVGNVHTTSLVPPSDWPVRSTASGVLVANRLNSSADITPNILINGNEGHVSFDSTQAPIGGTGSLKFSVLNTDVADAGDVFITFPDKGNGDTIWASYRRRAPAAHEFAMWNTSDGPSSRGAKWSILSHRNASNQPYECVIQNTNMRGNITGYHQDGSAFPPVDVAFNSACSSTDFKQVPSIDYSVTSALTGTDPDTGSAWSSCQIDRHRYGGLYNAQSVPVADFSWGLGDPLDGAFRAYPDEWITVTQRIIVGTFGSANSRWTVWAARLNQPYVLLWDLQNITLGAGGDLVFNTLWLLPYTTNRTSGGRSISARTNNITGVTLLGVGPSTPTGDGTLSYNSGTGRFTWAGNGQSAGTARGYSSGNGKLRLNLFASGRTASNFDQLMIEVNPASLPGGNQSDTVTVANGRPDTYVNYAEAIISTQAINAPGGYAPNDPNSSLLATTAANMASGTWAQIAALGTDIMGITGSQGGVGGNMIPYANQAVWDSITKAIRFMGSDHHGSDPTKGMNEIQYLDSTNTWSLVTPNVNPLSTPQHGYGHNAWRVDTGEFYVRQYNSGTANEIVWRKTHTGSWAQNLVGPSVYCQVGIGTAWWTGSLSGSGAMGAYIVWEQGLGHLLIYDPGPNTWQDITVSTPGGDGLYHGVCMYSPVKNVAVFGGGNAWPNNLWRLNSDRSVTALTNCPIQVGVQHGNLSYDPTSGNFLIWGGGSNQRKFYELNPAGSGTYTLLTGSRQPPAAGTNGVSDPSGGAGGPDALISCAIPDYGVVAYMSASGASYANMFIYKHS